MTEVKHVYVSPHADDVALSCGGQIIANPARQSEVLVLNLFTSESDSAGSRLFDSVNSDRTLEDKSAWDHLGIQTVYANLPEALLRKKFPFELTARARDDLTVRNAFDVLAAYVRSYPDAAFHFPAGFGSHVDHLACKRAAFRLLDEGRLDRIILYEDVPYSWLRFIRDRYYRSLRQELELDEESRTVAFRNEGEGLLDYLRGRSVPFPRGRKLFPIVYLSLLSKGGRSNSMKHKGRVSTATLTADQLEQKKQLILHYKSQIPMLFGEDPDRLLDGHRASFSKEVSIEVTKRPPA